MKPYVLYGMPGSLYTGKPRAYLRKQGIDFVEHAMGSTHFRERIVPLIGRFIVPVLETPDGELIQDGSDIIDHFERRGVAKWSAYPTSPRQSIVALIFELFGGEGLLRPAMHYRWDFPEQNERFLRFEFGRHLAPGQDAAQQAGIYDFASGRMKQAAAIFGVAPATASFIEAAYAEFLALFGAHCTQYPYLLGGRPSIGDYGLLAPLYAHLARDPMPADLMRRTAPAVARWVERMNAPNLDSAEFEAAPAAWLAGDEIPDTVSALLRYVREEYLAEITAQVEFLNGYLAKEVLAEGDVVGGAAGKRSLGMATFVWRGTTLSVGVFPYRVWLLQRIQDAYARLEANGREPVDALLSGVGLKSLLALKLTRRVERRDNREVWGVAA